MNEPKTRKQFYMPDLSALVCVEFIPYWLDFKIYEVNTWEQNGRPVLLRRGATSSAEDGVSWISEAETALEGFVKWDGCAEWLNQGFHVCGYDHAVVISRWVPFAFKLASEFLTGWNEECAGKPEGDFGPRFEFEGDDLSAIKNWPELP